MLHTSKYTENTAEVRNSIKSITHASASVQLPNSYMLVMAQCGFLKDLSSIIFWDCWSGTFADQNALHNAKPTETKH